MASRPSLTRSVAISSAGNVFAPAVGLLTAPILAQTLGVVGRGEVGAALAPMTLAISIFTFGIPEAITYVTAQKWARARRKFALAFVALGISGFLAALVIVAASNSLASGDSDLADLIGLAAIATAPTLVLSGLRAIAAGRQAWVIVSGEKVLSALARLTAVVVLSLSGDLSTVTACVAMAFIPLAGGLVYVSLLFRPKRQLACPRTETARREPDFWTFGIRVWFGSLAGILLVRVSQVLMVPLSDTYALGLFVVAVTISELVLIFNSAVRDVMFASESADSNAEKLGQAARLSTIITVAASIGVGTLSIWAVPLLFGKDFGPAVPVILVMLIGIAGGNPGSIAGAGLSARGRPGLRSISLLLALGLNLIAFFALVPSLGAMGGAIASVVGNLLSGFLNVYWLRRVFGLKISDFYIPRKSDFRKMLETINHAIKRS